MRLMPMLMIASLPLAVSAQQPRGASTPAAAMLDSARYSSTSRELRGLRWRLVGPFRGGRAVAVVGDQRDRNTFYFGSVNGGVWKTTNGGSSWSNITDGKSSISSVGAITIAP